VGASLASGLIAIRPSRRSAFAGVTTPSALCARSLRFSKEDSRRTYKSCSSCSLMRMGVIEETIATYSDAVEILGSRFGTSGAGTRGSRRLRLTSRSAFAKTPGQRCGPS
jgi:hypothetical protein